MGRRPAETIGELMTPSAPRKGAMKAARARTAAPGKPLSLPLPRHGGAYRRREVADVLGVVVGTVSSWVSKGRPRADDPAVIVYLRSLTMPRGRFAPEDVCEFLAATNGVAVYVRQDSHNEETDDNGKDHRSEDVANRDPRRSEGGPQADGAARPADGPQHHHGAEPGDDGATSAGLGEQDGSGAGTGAPGAEAPDDAGAHADGGDTGRDS